MKSYFESFNKYHTLKKNYEKALKYKRKTIRNSNELTMEQKILKLKNISIPCVMCGKKGGSKFYRKNRILYAKCGCETPCAFSMEIELSQNYDIPSAIKTRSKNLYEYKKNIVITKLNYLFDLEKNDITSQRFNVLKEDYVTLDKQVSLLKKLLKQQLELIDVLDENGNKKNIYRSEHKDDIVKTLHLHLKNMKTILHNHKKNPDKYSLKDYITIYLSNVLPIQESLRKVKYNQVYMDNFNLKQIKNNIENYSYADPETPGKVIENNFQKIKKKKKIRKNKSKKTKPKKDVVEEEKKELELEVENLDAPPTAIEKEELMEKTDDPEDTFDPDAQPIDEKSDELPVKDENDPEPIEQQSAVNIEDIGKLEEFQPEVDA